MYRDQTEKSSAQPPSQLTISIDSLPTNFKPPHLLVYVSKHIYSEPFASFLFSSDISDISDISQHHIIPKYRKETIPFIQMTYSARDIRNASQNYSTCTNFPILFHFPKKKEGWKWDFLFDPLLPRHLNSPLPLPKAPSPPPLLQQPPPPHFLAHLNTTQTHTSTPHTSTSHTHTHTNTHAHISNPHQKSLLRTRDLRPEEMV